MIRRRLARPALVAGALLLGSGAARAADKTTCLRAYESAQTDKNAGKLRASRKKLLVCVETECPALLRSDCTKWLAEVDRAMPTVTVVARSKGKDVTSARVFVDDEPLADALGGKPLEVDPGRRLIRVEAAGYAPVEQSLELREGEKNRQLALELEPVSKDGGPAAPPSAGLPAVSWVLAGVGAVGLVSFGYFGLKGLSRRSDLEDCKGECAERDVADVQADFDRADISLAVSALAFGGAAYFYFTRDGGSEKAKLEKRPAFAVGVAPRAGGATTSFQLRF